MSMITREWRTKFVTLTTTALIATMGMMAYSATPEETIKARQQHLKDLGAANKTINDQLKTDAPDKAKIKEAGATIKKSADDFANWFPKGSGPETGLKTDAKPEIWTDAATFAEKVKNFQTQAAKLVPLTEAGDIEGIKAQMGRTAFGGTCGACHENFRVKKPS
jgi:cytochrome c556